MQQVTEVYAAVYTDGGGQNELVGYRCGRCREVYTVFETVSLPQVKVRAERCCNAVCHRCGKPCQKHRTICSTCERKDEEMERQRQFETAEVLDPKDYKGAVFYDGDLDGEREFYESVDEFLSEMETFLVGYFEDVDAGEELPPLDPFFVWCCTEKHFRLNAKEVVSQFLEQGEHYDDAYSAISETAFNTLQTALNAWCEGVGITTHYADRTRIVSFSDKFLRAHFAP
jgi:hypothetical protein